MKKVSIVSLIALLAIVISSCGSSNVVSNHGISKRKYNKGFFFQRKSNLKTANKEVKEADLKEDKSIAKIEKTETRKAKKENVATTYDVMATSVESSDVARIEEPTQTTANLVVREHVVETDAFLSEDIDDINWVVTEENQYAADGQTIDRMPYENRVKTKKKVQKQGSRADAMFILAVIFAIILPPLGVGIYTNIDWMKVLIAFLLTLLGVVPGIVYALLVVFDVI